jgi:hypothetical protein
MATYARIASGVVAELFTPPEGVAIAACFAVGLVWVECDGTVGVVVGWTYSAGTFAAPVAPTLNLAQQAAAMLVAGIQIISTATPALNATYPCDPATNNDDGNILSAIAAGLSLPGGIAVRLDVTGVPHAFAVADFKNLCQAKLSFQLTLNTIIGSNAGTLPAQPFDIA